MLKSYLFSKSMVNYIERKQVRNKNNKHYPSIANLVVPATELSSYSEDSSEKSLQILNLRNFKPYNKRKQNVENFGKRPNDEINTHVKIVGVPFVTPLETLWTGQQHPNVMIRFRHDNTNSNESESNKRFSGGYNSCMACCQSPCCCQISRKLPKLEIKPCKYPQATFADQHFHQPINCMQSKVLFPVQKPTSLGAPVGLIHASSHTDTTPLLMRFAWYLKAMGLIYLKSIDKWTRNDLDLIIQEGKNPLMYKADNDAKVNNTEGNNRNEGANLDYLERESKIQTSFMFDGFQFKLRLDDGTWQKNLKINLYAALHKFFKSNTYCLILFREWYLLIWKKNKIFFVLDMNGRNSNTLFTEEQGKSDNLPVLICLKELINVIHLIVNMSKLDENESFLIRALKFAEVITPEGKVLTHQPETRTPEYKTINDNYSYLRSNFHLSLNPAKPEINRSGLPVGIAAMIASKIDHPATWDSKILDRVICYGVNLCRACWPSCGNFKEPINLDTFPRCIHIGQFIVNFELKSSAFTGFWKCRPVSLRSEFYAIIKAAFLKNENLLFQINNQMYAIWRKNNFYYLLDPYLHTIWGESSDIETKMATLRMFRNLDTLIKVFHHILLQSNRSANFYIHTFKVNGLGNCSNCHKEIEIPIEDDLKSLNEYIFFEDDYVTCFNELGQPSDYDDDIDSPVPSLLSLTTSLNEGEGEEEEDENEDDDEISKKWAKYMSQRKKNRKNKLISESDIDNNKNNKSQKMNLFGKQKNQDRNTTDTGIDINFNTKTKIRTDSKTDIRTDSKTDIRADSKTKKSFNSKTDNKTDINSDSKTKKRTDGKSDLRTDSKTDIRTDGKTKERTDGKNDIRTGSKTNIRTDSTTDKWSNIKTDSKTNKITDSNTDIKINRSSNRKSHKKSESKTNRRSDKKTDSKTNKKKDSTTDANDNILNSNKKQQKEKFDNTVILLKNLPKKDITRRSLAPLNKEATKHQVDALDICNKKLRALCNMFEAPVCEKKNSNLEGSCIKSDYNYFMDSSERTKQNIMSDSATKHQEEALEICKKKVRAICNMFEAPVCEKMNSNLEESCIRSDYNYFMDSCEIAKEKIVPHSKNDIMNTCDENIYNIRPRADPFLDQPTLSQQPKNLIISRSNSSTYESILKILYSSFKCCDRIFISTRYGNFVVFRGHDYLEDLFFVYDGCTYDVNRFRHMDLSTGTAGLIPFSSLHKVITYIMDTKKGTRECTAHGHTKEESANDVCKKRVYFNFLRI